MMDGAAAALLLGGAAFAGIVIALRLVTRIAFGGES